MERQDLAPSIFTISDVLTADECRQMIALAEERDFNAAPINVFGVERLDKETRNNDRVIVDDCDLARRLWSRVEEFVPHMLVGRLVRGLNERFRYYRYAPGQRFAWHFDGSFARPNGEVSLLTFMIYLNEGYEGGETNCNFISRIADGSDAVRGIYNIATTSVDVNSARVKNSAIGVLHRTTRAMVDSVTALFCTDGFTPQQSVSPAMRRC